MKLPIGELTLFAAVEAVATTAGTTLGSGIVAHGAVRWRGGHFGGEEMRCASGFVNRLKIIDLNDQDCTAFYTTTLVGLRPGIRFMARTNCIRASTPFNRLSRSRIRGKRANIRDTLVESWDTVKSFLLQVLLSTQVFIYYISLQGFSNFCVTSCSAMTLKVIRTDVHRCPMQTRYVDKHYPRKRPRIILKEVI